MNFQNKHTNVLRMKNKVMQLLCKLRQIKNNYIRGCLFWTENRIFLFESQFSFTSRVKIADNHQINLTYVHTAKIMNRYCSTSPCWKFEIDSLFQLFNHLEQSHRLYEGQTIVLQTRTSRQTIRRTAQHVLRIAQEGTEYS